MTASRKVDPSGAFAPPATGGRARWRITLVAQGTHATAASVNPFPRAAAIASSAFDRRSRRGRRRRPRPASPAALESDEDALRLLRPALGPRPRDLPGERRRRRRSPCRRPSGSRPLVEGLREALERDDRRAVEAAASGLALGLARQLALPPVRLQVLAVRPSAQLGRAARPLHAGRAAAAADPAVDADGAPPPRRRLPHLPADAPPRDGPPRRLRAPAPRRLVPHRGLLQAGVEPLPPARARAGAAGGQDSEEPRRA